MIAQGNALGLCSKDFKPCKGDTISGCGGEGGFEDGLEEVGGVGARVRDFSSQRADAARQRRHARHDRRLLGQRRERDENVRQVW